ncbi:unnamed protein product [Darwinula stevensoni]|uniref:DNA ligase 1 n=1 Tax=Darwinula stevensoni TaxID=69355 RepID=A0A7R8XJI3_9CRUS|nr:unnamed protein product [Darwinula stevensoni]CAG0892252.1 unnamed protein product [Darwinula stevensoni]
MRRSFFQKAEKTLLSPPEDRNRNEPDPSTPPLRKTARKTIPKGNGESQKKQIAILKELAAQATEKPCQSPGSDGSLSEGSKETLSNGATKSGKGKRKRIIYSDSEESNDTPHSKKPSVSDETVTTPNESPIKKELSDIDAEDTPKERENLNDENQSKQDDARGQSCEKSKGKKKAGAGKRRQKNGQERNSKGTSEEDERSDANSSKDTRPVEQKTSAILPFFQKKSEKPESKDDITSDYQPDKAQYHPIEDACWKRGEKVPYWALAKALQAIEATSSRLKMIDILANYFRSVMVLTPEDLLPSVYMCLNKIAPAWEGREYMHALFHTCCLSHFLFHFTWHLHAAQELGVGESHLMKAIGRATGRSVDKIKADIGNKGDLGIVAETSKSHQRMMFQPPRLMLRTVFEKLKEIALMTGHAVVNKKIEKIQGLLVACRQSEARYFIRSLQGKLRIGLAEQSILQALAQSCVLTPPGQDYPPEILDASKGISSDSFKSKLESSALLLKTTYCIMIHLLESGDMHIYSRNQEDNTSKYPDIISKFKSWIAEKENHDPQVVSCILDSEAVAWDREKEMILPFQVLSTRKRKDANESEIKVHVCIFAFDLLYLNGESLVKKPFLERRQLLRTHFKDIPGEFVFAKSMDSTNTEDIAEFLEESVKGNCEGLMVKTLETEASYEIAKRSHKWLKLKKDYLEGVGDTLDVVPIGGYLGKGKRTGTYGGFLLAVYDTDNEEFQTVCKIGTGFSDEQLTTHTEFFKKHLMEGPKSYYRYDSSLAPDHWFEPVQVWEIKCADLSISPIHKAGAGIVDPEKGISLRFPRFLHIRDDKTPEDATTAAQVGEMYGNQEQVKNKASGTQKLDDEGFY